jgi:hypothetical protein
MWKKFVDFARSLFVLGDALRQNKADIKELQSEVRQISTAMQVLIGEMRHLRAIEALEREKITLQIENALLKKENPK